MQMKLAVLVQSWVDSEKLCFGVGLVKNLQEFVQETKSDIKRQCHSQNRNQVLPKLENTISSITPITEGSPQAFTCLVYWLWRLAQVKGRESW